MQYNKTLQLIVAKPKILHLKLNVSNLLYTNFFHFRACLGYHGWLSKKRQTIYTYI